MDYVPRELVNLGFLQLHELLLALLGRCAVLLWKRNAKGSEQALVKTRW